MIGPYFLLLRLQGPDAHYAGGASSTTAGTTATLGRLFRFLLSSVPQWVQIAGIVIGGPVALIVAWQVWRRRRALWAWFLARSLQFKLAMFGAVAVAALAGGGTGLYGYNYVMHNNDFCQSCHIMDASWNRFQASAHKNLQCHACHRQPLYVSSIELYHWVTERTMAVPPHDKVPNPVCEDCHLRPGTDSARTDVMLTAGHALHLKSDSSALRNVQCVTCHGRDFHRFVPNNATCEQSGCHVNQRVVLGAMSSAKFMHCTICHDFNTRVPPGETARQAARNLTPRALDCSTCHAMTQKMLAFDFADDPHRGSCGSCHDPHTQTEPRDAYKTCASAQCHGSVDTLTAFHRGLGPHTLDQCGACHAAHSWKVRGTDCLACHKNIFQDRPGAAPSRRASSRRASSRRAAARRGGAGARGVRMVAASFVRLPAPLRAPVAAQAVPPAPVQGADSLFQHSRHRGIACTECHATTMTHGALKITAPAGCLGCHHAAAQRASCETCHAAGPPAPYGVPVAFAIAARRDTVTRTIPFAHARHTSIACTRCHGSDVNRTVAPGTCNGCHADHHAAERDCASCHPSARTGHDRSAHEGCAGCHTDARVAALVSSRSLCLACHQEQREHYPARECGSCHLVALVPGAKGARGP